MNARHRHSGATRKVVGVMLAAGVAFGLANAPATATVADAPTQAERVVNGDLLLLIDGDLYLMRANGTNLRRIAALGEEDIRARFSPDGSKIVFADSAGSPSDVYIMNSNGTGRRNLTATPDASEKEPSFSRDGSKVAFKSFGPSTGTIAFMDARPGAPRTTVIQDGPLSPYCAEDGSWPDGKYGEPLWSPVADHLAVTQNCFSDPWSMDMVRIIGPLGKRIAAFGRYTDDKTHLDFSPDGRKIVYAIEDRDVGSWLEVIDRRSGTVSTITNVEEVWAYTPAWSPDGARITASLSGDVYTMRPDGTDPRLIKRADGRWIEVLDWRAAR